MEKRKNKKLTALTLILCCCMVLSFSSVAFAATDVTGYINDTYTYAKGSDSTVLSDAELKAALKAETDYIILGAGRDSSSVVTANEFSGYLGYVNYNLRNGNGSYTVDDFLRAALAVGTCGNAANVGKDANGNTINLLYKGLYSRSYATLSQSPSRLAYALLTVNANGISDASLNNFTRNDLKQGVIQAASSSSDVYTSALLLQALAPYYRNNEQAAKAACNTLLKQISSKVSADGTVSGSCKDTAMVVTALCELKLNPEGNSAISQNVLSGLLSFKKSGSGFTATVGGALDATATNAGRIALVAFNCYQNGQSFFDYGNCKDYPITSIGSNTNSGSSSSSKSSSSGKSSSSSSKSSGTKSNSKSSSSSSSSKSSSSDTAKSTAATTIKHLSSEGTTITKAEFEKIKGQNTTLIYEGTWGESEAYTLSFNGKNVTEAKDFNALIVADIEHQTEIEAAADQSEYFRFQHTGSFPGKATVTITVSTVDGSYQCYHYNDDTGKFEAIGNAVVNNGMATFEASAGGDYFLTPSEEAAVDESGQFMSLSDTVDGVVPKSVFEGIMGKAVDLTLDGETDREVYYNIVFHGKDIETPMDFNMKITEKSPNKKAIAKLTESPIIIHFEQDGEIPGDATVTVYANLDASETYGLYYYNEETGEGEYIGDISVGDGEFSFKIEHCCDYFIAKGESSAVLMDSVGTGLIIFFIVLAVLLIGGFIGYYYLRKKGISITELFKGIGRKKDKEETSEIIDGEAELNNLAEEISVIDDNHTDSEDNIEGNISESDFDDVIWESPAEPQVDTVDAEEEAPAESQADFSDVVWESPSEPQTDIDIDSFASPKDEE